MKIELVLLYQGWWMNRRIFSVLAPKPPGPSVRVWLPDRSVRHCHKPRVFLFFRAENENTTQNPTTAAINSSSTPTPSTSPTVPNYGNGPWEDVRLPKYFVPVHYNLSLTVDLVNLVFHGNVSVDVKVENDTKYMFLHVNKLNMTSTPMLFNSGKDIDLYITRLHIVLGPKKAKPLKVNTKNNDCACVSL